MLAKAAEAYINSAIDKKERRIVIASRREKKTFPGYSLIGKRLRTAEGVITHARRQIFRKNGNGRSRQTFQAARLGPHATAQFFSFAQPRKASH